MITGVKDNLTAVVQQQCNEIGDLSNLVDQQEEGQD